MNGNVSVKKFNREFFDQIPPTKLTEARKLKLNSVSWGLITEYYLESVKINDQKTPAVATIKIEDVSGEVACAIKGKAVGLLFGLTPEKWSELESLSSCGKQLFFRYFKDGLNDTFLPEQKIFYAFCLTQQRQDMLVAVYCRRKNWRNKNENEVFLEVLDLRKCDMFYIDRYIDGLRENMTDVNSNNNSTK